MKTTLAASLIIGVSGAGLLPAQTPLRSTIAFVSTRHDTTVGPTSDPQRPMLAAEIYLMNGDGTNPRRLTENAAFDGFPALAPDGRRIVFDSNRRRAAGEPFNTSDLFVMNTDGTGQTLLTRGSSATWSPDGKQIALHASASGTGLPIKTDPGAATSDNDIFVLTVDGFPGNGARPKNITNSPAAIDDDPDWSPDGRTILFTSHAVTDNPVNSPSTEIYEIAADGSGQPARLTSNAEEERAPAWSPDGKRIVFSCRRGGSDFEICVMNRDGTGQVQLTDNDIPDLTPTWSPDGAKIAFHRRVGGRGQFQLFVMNADGTGEVQLTSPPGINAFPNWGEALPTNAAPIRSSLRTVDIASGRIDVVYNDDRHFEAPNWSRDGRFFIVNMQGRLYRLPSTGAKSLEEIPTGFATRANNDHGISPDGRSLVMSHSAAEHITDPAQDWLASSVYVLPLGGSPTPKKVTTQAPSFWHGWSPDGKTLAFVGRRNDEWDIYTIPVGGGEERRITTCAGLDDGPDYSPDGAFIYYNSFCSGKMEIWRMRADGSRPEQLTRDAYSNWFPHPSPDGRWVVYIAYLEDQGADHPFGRQVKLRFMNVRDRSVRDLTPPFFGGQGTINVPSWSPDSRRVAFVVYEQH